MPVLYVYADRSGRRCNLSFLVGYFHLSNSSLCAGVIGNSYNVQSTVYSWRFVMWAAYATMARTMAIRTKHAITFWEFMLYEPSVKSGSISNCFSVLLSTTAYVI